MIQVYSNIDFDRSWQIIQDDGNPVDITNGLCELVIYNASKDDIIFACNTTNYINRLITDGIFECNIPGVIFDIPPGDYFLTCKAIVGPTDDRRIISLESDYLTILFME